MATRPAPQCGTVEAYRRHKWLGESIDDACRKAFNRAERTRPRLKAYQKARQRAMAELSRRHPQAFAALLAEEMKVEQQKHPDGDLDGKSLRSARWRARQRALTKLSQLQHLSKEFAALLAAELAKEGQAPPRAKRARNRPATL